MSLKKIDKIIYYYQLEINFEKGFSANDGNLFRELFHRLLLLVQAKDPSRYVTSLNKTLFINDIDFDPSRKFIYGKIRLIKDEFPELIHTGTDQTREIEAAEEEGIVETSHFVIDYSRKTKFMAMEYHQSGAKYLDLIDYLKEIGIKQKWISGITVYNVVQDVLKELKSRINNISEMTVKVSKTNVDAIKKIDVPTFEALDNMQDHFEQEYAEIKLKFDYTDLTKAPKTRSTFMTLIDRLVANKKRLNNFDILKIRAEDSLKRNKLEAFNLLIDKLSSDIKVEKREKSRIISSVHMFEMMFKELERIKSRLK
uniref:hypothetical protein n=1 Tax=Pedobacter schmidteae TaxID=2201271 RepID=UPI000EAF30FE|nr:hypothetical protein [Pedobacter schmidteae]